MDSAVRKIPFQSEMTNYRPYKVPYPGRPKQLEFSPHTQSWRECSKCSEALAKALTFLKQKPDYGFVSNYFSGFTFMMAEGCEKELAQCIAAARSQCEPAWGGYSNWKISMSMMLLAEYSIRYGLTPENRVALMTGHQYAAEQIDDGGGWFHHPKQGGVNYAWDISPIGCMYFSAFQEMDALGLDAQPGLTLSRGYVERLSDGWSFGYGTPFTEGRWGSVGKNGLVMMSFYAAGKKNEPFPRMLGDFLTDNPEAAPKAHATGQLPFFGAGMGNHLMGPEHYAKYAGYWLHPLIDCQKSDGGIAQFPHDDTEARSGMPPEKVLEEVKSSSQHDYSATAVLASLILMTEPGAYSGKTMVKGPLVSKNKKSSPVPSVPKVVAKLPVVSGENALLWDAKLKARAGALAKEDLQLIIQLNATKGSVKVLSIVEDKVTVGLENGGQGEVPWKLFEMGDKLGLALAIAAVKDTPEDHALSAFYLLLDGNTAKADLHLKQAGQHAVDVLTVFGMKAP